MKILAIETSSKICSVAILEDNVLIKEKTINDDNTHSIKLMPLIEKIFNETNLKIGDIDLFCSDKGPGSFTGIRIGIATIKAFIDVTQKNGIGISSLEALAYNVKKEGIICSLIDAKNDNVYAGLFEHKEGKYIQIDEFKTDNIINILNEYINKEKSIIFVGDGLISYKNCIIEKFGNNAIFEENNELNATNIGIAAYNKIKNNKEETFSLTPLYLRKSNAERMLEEKNNGNKNL